MYSKDLELNSYINCLWSYFQSYYKSINKNIKNQEIKWLKILERSTLKLNKNKIESLIKEPNYIFKITKYKDINLNQIQLIKIRFFISLYWLNYLLLIVNSNKKINIFSFDHFLLINWTDSIDTIISIFESRNELLILERDTIYNNLKELEKIKLKCPNLDDIHQKRLESQLKALRYILNLESTDDLRELSNNLKELNVLKLENINSIFDNLDNLKKNLSNFIDLFEHISQELLSKYVDIHISLFEIDKDNYYNLINTNLNLKRELIRYRDMIYNTKSITWSTLDNIKIIELKINLKDIRISNFLISKSDQLCNLIFKIILNNNSNLLSENKINKYLALQNNIISSINNLKVIKDKNYKIISDLEKTFNYSDLKELDLEFYYQFLTHLNTIIYGITKEKEVNINTKKYLSDENFMDRKKFNMLLKTLDKQFVSKKEFKNKINQIETRITNIEENKPAYVLGTMVISLISLFIWKKMIRFKTKNYN